MQTAIIQPARLSISVWFFFSPPLFVPQPILRWTLAVLSQHNTINNALAEGAMWARAQKLFLCPKQIHWFVFYLQQKWRRPLCRVGGGGVDALEMINNLKYEAVTQEKCRTNTDADNIWRLSCIFISASSMQICSAGSGSRPHRTLLS